MIVGFKDGEAIPVERLRMLSEIFGRITSDVTVQISGGKVTFFIGQPPQKTKSASEMLRDQLYHEGGRL